MNKDEQFNPEDHMWFFMFYSNLEFTFRTVNEPAHYVTVAADPVEMFMASYRVSTAPMTFDQVTGYNGLKIVRIDGEEVN